MRDNEKEDARKRGGGGGGRINEEGRIHDNNSFDVEKWGGGRSGDTLRYIVWKVSSQVLWRTHKHDAVC